MVANLETKPTSIPSASLGASLGESLGESLVESLMKLSVEQYHWMIEYGIFNEDSQIELLEGLLITKMPKNPPHRISTKLLLTLLEQMVPEGWYVDSQEPITLENSEPEPDIAIICGHTTDYRDRHPNAKEIALIIEVSDSTLDRDRSIKQKIYAKSGIPIYWILNLSDRTLEVYTQPSKEGKYNECQILKETELVILTINQTEIASFNVGSVL
jgi:Uma2 family endonuclease